MVKEGHEIKEKFLKYQKAGFACLPTKEDKSPVIAWKGGVKDPEAYKNAKGIGVVWA